MLQEALEGEVEAFIERHALLRDAAGRREVVRNGYKPGRRVMTGAGPLEIKQPRVRDNGENSERVGFSSSILPPFLRRSKKIDALIPWLSLKGLTPGAMSEALQALMGPDANGHGGRLLGDVRRPGGHGTEHRVERRWGAHRAGGVDVAERGTRQICAEQDGARGSWRTGTA